MFGSFSLDMIFTSFRKSFLEKQGRGGGMPSGGPAASLLPLRSSTHPRVHTDSLVPQTLPLCWFPSCVSLDRSPLFTASPPFFQTPPWSSPGILGGIWP